MKDKLFAIELDKPRDLLFSLNAAEAVIERYKEKDMEIDNQLTFMFGKIGEQIDSNNLKEIRFLLTLMLNEAINYNNFVSGEKEPNLSEKEVGTIISIPERDEISSAIIKAVLGSMPASGAESKNAETTQQE